jgi:spermidine synthase
MHAEGSQVGRSAVLPTRLAATLSGVSALAAQMVWIRALGRGLGTTVESLAAVAGVFLAGLGVGAWLGGRLAERSPRPGRAAALALFAAAALLLVSPWLFGALPGLHLGLLGLLGVEPGPSPWPALLLALPLLLVPTTLMGLTFPLLVAAGRGTAAAGSRGVGALYACNTAGAALGVVLTVLALPALGERLTLACAAVLEAGAALCLLRLGGGALPTPPEVRGGAGARRPALLLAATGLAGLAAEVAAFRLLEPFSGPHLWGVLLLLVPVLGGIALGGWVGGRVAGATATPARALTVALLLAGLCVLVMPAVAGTLPRLLLADGGARGLGRVALLLLGSTLALGPTMVALGACFPLAVRAAVDAGAGAARASGELGAWNSLGSLAGSLLAGFVLLPSQGAAATLLLVAGLLLALAPLWRLAQPPPERRLVVAVAAALPLLVLLVVPSVRTALLSAGPDLSEVVVVATRRPPIAFTADQRAEPLELAGAEDVVLFAEWFGGRGARLPGVRSGPVLPPIDGRMGTVGLLEEPGGHVRLRVNGLSEAHIDPRAPDRGSVTEVALGLLPVLAHPAPRRGLVIGHGAGWTAEAVISTGLEHVDVAELDATVLDVVETYRGHPLEARTNPRARLWLTDGRLLLRRAARGDAPRYDVIASQPSHPWVPGAGHLFTLEAYRLAREALTERGVFAQWLNLFEMTPDLVASCLATFREAFPRCWVFLFHEEAVLLGFSGEPSVDPARWARMLGENEAVRALAGPVGLATPGDLWRRFTLDEGGVERLAPRATTALVEDDRPHLELGLAWRVLTDADTAEMLAGKPVDLRALLQGAFPPDILRAVPDAPARQRLTQQAIDSLVAAGDLDLAARWDVLDSWGNEGEARLTRAALARARGDAAGAERWLAMAVADDPRPGIVGAWIGMLVAIARDDPPRAAWARSEGERLAALFPDHGPVRAVFALLLATVGDLKAARAEYEAALRATSPPAAPGAVVDYARLVLLEPPPAPDAAPGPEIGPEMHALELLRSLPVEKMDADALDTLARLEARLGDDLNAAAAQARADEARREQARRVFDHGWLMLQTLDGSALGPAEHATDLDPGSARAWELGALALLQRARRAPDRLQAQQFEDGARVALGRALRASSQPARARERALAYLRWYGVPAQGLTPASDE